MMIVELKSRRLAGRKNRVLLFNRKYCHSRKSKSTEVWRAAEGVTQEEAQEVRLTEQQTSRGGRREHFAHRRTLKGNKKQLGIVRTETTNKGDHTKHKTLSK